MCPGPFERPQATATKENAGGAHFGWKNSEEVDGVEPGICHRRVLRTHYFIFIFLNAHDAFDAVGLPRSELAHVCAEGPWIHLSSW